MVAINPYFVVLGGRFLILGLRLMPMVPTSRKLLLEEFSPASSDDGGGVVLGFGLLCVIVCSPGSLNDTCRVCLTDGDADGEGGLVDKFSSGYNHLKASCCSSSVVRSVEDSRSLVQNGGGSLEERYGMVRKSSSKTTWNCGLTSPVRRFNTIATEPAWRGEWPK